MKSIFMMVLLSLSAFIVSAQQASVSLEASGLTCSMCSKAVLNALEEVDNVNKVRVDIKNQQYQISFTDDTKINFDALAKAVEDAGFSVANLKVTMEVPPTKLGKDEHVQIGSQYFHFLNAGNQQLEGKASFTLVDKNFTSAKNFKKYSAMSKMECVQTGKTSHCCSSEIQKDSRIYHAII